ncbi:MAG: GDSL-type esterase/lipase family protein [Crocinitomicaceae bacterium]
MKEILTILSVLLLTGSFAQDTIIPAADTVVNESYNDSLSAYAFPDFRDIDMSTHSKYPFVHFEKNNYEFFNQSSPNFEILHDKFRRLIDDKKGKINMYHIGGSHVQADIYTNDVREYMQERWSGIPGERGWVFPFDLAKTNNPGNYEFSSPNTWDPYRCIPHRPSKYDFDYGVLGAGITCADTVITIKFEYDKTTSKPPIQSVRIFHNIGEFPYWINFGSDELLVIGGEHNAELGYTDVNFSDGLDSMNIQFQYKGRNAPELEIYGFLLMNDLPGVSYTAVGINGAGLYTYLANVRFEEQLKTYPPDFFAYAVGTNDGNTTYDKFKPSVYKRNLEKMMQMALRANPNCALLLTVPNDSYYHRRYLNKNIARERTVIKELAAEYGMAVWDLYGIMGELGSSKTWQTNKLMRSDKIHFTHDGYHLKGEMFIDGFLKYMDQMDERKMQLNN